MRRLAYVILAAAVIGGVTYTFRAPLATKLVEAVAQRRMAADPIADLPEGMHVVLCGAGSPLPDPLRSGPPQVLCC